MNKAILFALCVGLTGVGVLVWVHFAVAGKSASPETPLALTFISGDVSAAPQSIRGTISGTEIAAAGPVSLSIDFAKYAASGVCSGDLTLLNLLPSPITGNLRIDVSAANTKNGMQLSTKIGNTAANIVLGFGQMGFPCSKISMTSTPTSNTVQAAEGGFSLFYGNKRSLICDKVVAASFSVSK